MGMVSGVYAIRPAHRSLATFIFHLSSLIFHLSKAHRSQPIFDFVEVATLVVCVNEFPPTRSLATFIFHLSSFNSQRLTTHRPSFIFHLSSFIFHLSSPNIHLLQRVVVA